MAAGKFSHERNSGMGGFSPRNLILQAVKASKNPEEKIGQNDPHKDCETKVFKVAVRLAKDGRIKIRTNASSLILPVLLRRYLWEKETQ